MSTIEQISKKLDLPKWWIESVVVECLDCRIFFPNNKSGIKFNLSEIRKDDIEKIKEQKVLLTAPIIFHNISTESHKTRMLVALIGGYPIEPIKDPGLLMPEGSVKVDYIPFQVNSIDVWDPKRSMSETALVLDNGKLFQWKIATLQTIEKNGRQRALYRSEHFDFAEIEKIQNEITEILNDKKFEHVERINVGRNLLTQKYNKLEIEFIKVRDEVHKYHLQKIKELKETSVRKEELPQAPTITLIDSVDKGPKHEILVRTSLEAVLFRTAYQSSLKAEKEHEKVGRQEDIIRSMVKELEYSIIAITSAVQCLEAYINHVGLLEISTIWKEIEKIEIKQKWIVIPRLVVNKDVFNRGSEPFQSFSKVVGLRNRIVHHKQEFGIFHETQDFGYTCKVFKDINSINAKLSTETTIKMITKLCDERVIIKPIWLDTTTSWIKE
jgi:uncharacterized protein YutE (UPF0331/DUF86 family)